MQPLPTRRYAWLTVLFAGVIVFILWNTPQLDFILYPFRLFVTYVHEAGHGSMAILTGGQFVRFEIFPNGAGQASTIGGLRWLILPAGYLGAALFGAVLFYLTNRLHYNRAISIILGVGLIIFSVLFGGLLTTAFLVGIGFGLALIGLGWYVKYEDVHKIVLDVLAIMTGLNAVLDIWFLVGSSGASLGSVQNDAAAFSRDVAPLIPAAVWALVWAALAVVMLGVAVWYGLVKRKS